MMKKDKFWINKKKVLKNNDLVINNIPFNRKSKFFFWRNKINISDRKKSVKKFSWISLIFFSIFFSILILSLQEFKIGFVKGGSQELVDTIAKIFKFENNSSLIEGDIWKRSFDAIISTIKITLLGTTFGVILSIPTSFLSARNINKIKWISTPIRFIMSFFRTVPPIVFAIILSSGFSPTLAATLTLMFFTWATMNKLLYEEIENTSLDSYNSLISTGSSKISAFRFSVLKKISPKIASLSLYSFEINLRISAILGVIGSIGGIGSIMNLFTRYTEMTHLGIPLTLLVVTVIFIEAISYSLRVFVFEKKGTEYDLEALKNFTNDRDYKIQLVKNKYEVKKRKSNLEKIKILEKKENDKILRIKNKYKNLTPKEKHLFKKNHLATVKNKYKIKREKINISFNKKINIAKKKNKSNNLLKYQIAFKQAIANLDNLEKKEINIFDSSSHSSKAVLFVEKKTNSSLIIKLLISLVFTSLFFWSLSGMDFAIKDNYKLNENISYLFKPNLSIFGKALNETLTGTLVAFFATFIGGILAFIFGMLASRKITSIFISPIFQFLIIVIRVIPAFVVALVVWPILISPPFAAVIALSLHSIGMLGKLTKEQFDSIDPGPGKSIRAAGGTWVDVIRFSIFPQVLPNIISVNIYRFEINIKSMIEIGIVARAISPFGFNMNSYFDLGASESKYYGYAYSYLWSIIIIVVIVEFLSNIIRSYILTGLLPSWIYKMIKRLSKKRTIKKMIYLNNISYNVKDMSGEDIKLTYSLEKQAQLDFAETNFLSNNDSFKKYKEYKFKLNNLLNVSQFDGNFIKTSNFKNDTKKIKEKIRKSKKKFNRELKENKKMFKSENLKIKENIDNDSFSNLIETKLGNIDTDIDVVSASVEDSVVADINILVD
ncbi:MAG: ABC transporter permease subunit, partial [Mycoplasmatales bacterium]|nr:ABC transporter permease subunit [Mycoplasmatales bacterium]